MEIHIILINNLRNSSSQYATILKINFMQEHMKYHGMTKTYQHMGIIMGDHHIYLPQFDPLKLASQFLTQYINSTKHINHLGMYNTHGALLVQPLSWH